MGDVIHALTVFDWSPRQIEAGLKASQAFWDQLAEKLGFEFEHYPCVHITNKHGDQHIAIIIRAAEVEGALEIEQANADAEAIVLDGDAWIDLRTGEVVAGRDPF